MCGIAGYTGRQSGAPIVLEDLSRLEYRGYDSAGIAVLDNDGALTVAKDAGKLAILRDSLQGAMPQGTCAIGHTRWATHGRATQINAHPHCDTFGDVVVIHNGIVENHRQLRAELEASGCVFRSETDTEVIPHLVAGFLAEGADLAEATR